MHSLFVLVMLVLLILVDCSKKSLGINRTNEIFTSFQIFFRASEVLQWLVPDIVALLMSTFLFTILKSFCKGRKDEQDHLKTVLSEKSKKDTKKLSDEMTIAQYKKIRELGKFSSIAALGLAGVVLPSIVNGIYFIGFLSFSTWLACNRELHKKFAVTLKVLSYILAVHIFSVIFFQIPWFQNLIEEGNWISLVLGLSAIFKTTKESPLVFDPSLKLDNYLNPFILVATYFVITSTSVFILVSLVPTIFLNIHD